MRDKRKRNKGEDGGVYAPFHFIFCSGCAKGTIHLSRPLTSKAAMKWLLEQVGPKGRLGAERRAAGKVSCKPVTSPISARSTSEVSSDDETQTTLFA